MTSWFIEVGDALERLQAMPDESVQACVTSPPYFGLRDYGVDGQIGLEATLDDFLARLLAVFAEVHRVLRSDGTLWVNMGDSYATVDGSTRTRGSTGLDRPSLRARPAVRGAAPQGSAKRKDLMGVPWLLAFALREQGWWLREDIIWHKPSPMPEPVTDRCTRAHEYIFRLAKSSRYYADQDAIREPLAAKTLTTFGTSRTPLGGGGLVKADNYARAVPDRRPRVDVDGEPVGANKRSVWTVRGTPYPAVHFATFPPELVEPMILASTAPSACGVCGAPYKRQLAKREPIEGRGSGNGFALAHRISGGQAGGDETHWTPGHRRTIGWEPTCNHDDASGRCVVLDPFAGAGTTGLVALRHGRSFVGIEINADYADLARRRIIDDAPLLNAYAEALAPALDGLGGKR